MAAERRPDIHTPLPGPKAAEWIARDAKAMSPSFTRAYPFVMDHGSGCWVTDVDGNCFLDFTAGVARGTTRPPPPPGGGGVGGGGAPVLSIFGAGFYLPPPARRGGAAPGQRPPG